MVLNFVKNGMNEGPLIEDSVWTSKVPFQTCVPLFLPWKLPGLKAVAFCLYKICFESVSYLDDRVHSGFRRQTLSEHYGWPFYWGNYTNRLRYDIRLLVRTIYRLVRACRLDWREILFDDWVVRGYQMVFLGHRRRKRWKSWSEIAIYWNLS